MRLAYRIISRISLTLIILLTVWASLFYFIVVEEIVDETDDALEDLSENIITRALAGESLPSNDNGTNNSFYLTEITKEYAEQSPTLRYYDEMVFIHTKNETEPARILKTIFSDSEDRYFELTVAIPTIEKSDLQHAILFWIVILYLALLFVIIGLNYLILQTSFKPLYKLLDWLENFSVGKKFVEPNIQTKVTEFEKLNTAIVRSSYRNIELYEQQKSFIGHASHELQTPLAVCYNRLEMLSEDPIFEEKQLEEILKTKQSLEYAIKLNKTLLLLTKIENEQFPETIEIDVNSLIKKLIRDYQEVYSNRRISVSLQEETLLKLQMNETLAHILFGNILKNAFFHNYSEGEILIQIKSKSVIFSNTGAEENLSEQVIFSPFYKGTPKEGSTGLGLTLSKSICRLYKMDIIYKFNDKKHLFIVEF